MTQMMYDITHSLYLCHVSYFELLVWINWLAYLLTSWLFIAVSYLLFVIRQEHKKHSPSCPFLSIQKPSEMTVEDTEKVLRERYRLLVVSL